MILRVSPFNFTNATIAGEDIYSRVQYLDNEGYNNTHTHTVVHVV